MSPKKNIVRNLLFAICLGGGGLLLLLHPAMAIFNTEDFPPRWLCGNWTPLHGWIHILSDVTIWAAYNAIPIVIVYYMWRRQEVVFPKVAWLFAAFIFACGTGHLMEAIIFWWPAYRLAAVIKLITAIASMGTVIALIPIIPKALAFPSKLMEIQTFMEHAPIGMLVAERHGRILMVNQQVEELFGFDRREIVGETVERLVPQAIRPGHPELVESYFSEPTVKQLGEGRELYGCHKDGSEIPVEIGLTPLTVNGQLVVLACLVDHTNQKRRRQKELAELSQVLSLGEVVGGLAHELNTPVQRIVTWASVLQLEELPSQYEESIHGMTSAAGEVSEIVRRLREVVIRREVVDRPLNLNIVIQETVAFMHREVTGVRTSLAEDLPTISCDPIQLQLVLSNLIRNAYQAGGPVTISTTSREQQVICTVDDCGPGFQAGTKRLFDPFFTTKPSGLGMGLTITQAILRRYGGRITAHNQEHGARFEFSLPAT